MKEIRHILGGWLFAPPEAYNYFAELHNELCDLEDRPWEKKSLKEPQLVSYILACAEPFRVPEYGPYPAAVFYTVGRMNFATRIALSMEYGLVPAKVHNI